MQSKWFLALVCLMAILMVVGTVTLTDRIGRAEADAADAKQISQAKDRKIEAQDKEIAILKLSQEKQAEQIEILLQMCSELQGQVFIPLDIPLEDELQAYTVKTCREYGIEPMILFNLMHRESRYQVDAWCIDSNGLPSSGLCQVNAITYPFLAERGIDPSESPQANIKAACELISYYRDERGYTMLEALAAYAVGEQGMKQGKGFEAARKLLKEDSQ